MNYQEVIHLFMCDEDNGNDNRRLDRIFRVDKIGVMQI
jgi:hypothetical protein